MPVMDGLTATRRIRENAAWATLPVIAQNALGAPGLWLRAEPGEDAAQSAALAALIAESLSAIAPVAALLTRVAP